MAVVLLWMKIERGLELFSNHSISDIGICENFYIVTGKINVNVFRNQNLSAKKKLIQIKKLKTL